MAKKHFDFIVLGQGICGTLLSRSLIQAGKKVLVIDHNRPFSASKVASGVINPVTGRRIVKTWRIDELLPYALQTYNAFGSELGSALVRQTSILEFHPTLQMKEAFDSRLAEEPEYLHSVNDDHDWKSLFNFIYGLGCVAPCLLVDIHTMLIKWRNILSTQGSLLEERMDWNECMVLTDGVRYKDFTAGKIVCCEGVDGFNNPYFKNLPYSHMKGEALIVSIPELPPTNIYKQGLNIVPWHDGLFWVGSSYEWNFKDLKPTDAFRKRTEMQLHNWLRVPFTVVDHVAANRPANVERRPFVGLHPSYPSVGIFNGMGAKGCSLAPFFANQFTNHLLHGTPLYPDADVKRFGKVLTRKVF